MLLYFWALNKVNFDLVEMLPVDQTEVCFYRVMLWLQKPHWTLCYHSCIPYNRPRCGQPISLTAISHVCLQPF